MKMLIPVLVLVTSSIVAGQRGSFSGPKPIGFPDTPNRTTTTPDPLGNRFGNGTPLTLPIEANGDWDLVDRLSKLPVDKQPFWFINWQAYDKQRKDPPQTFPQRPNPFLDPLSLQINANSGQVNNGFSTPTPGFISTEPTVIFNRFGTTTVPSQPSNNVNPNGNLNNNAYPVPNMYPSYVYNTGNPNSNVNPSGNPNSNVNPSGNPNSNVNPSGNPNSNVYQTSNLNSHLNSGTVTKNGASFQTTQNFQWKTSQSFVSSNVGATNLKTNPEYYPQTDTYPPTSGQLFF